MGGHRVGLLGRLIVDGEEQPLSLMKLVKATQTNTAPNNSIIAFHDNSSVIKGFTVPVACIRYNSCYLALSTCC